MSNSVLPTIKPPIIIDAKSIAKITRSRNSLPFKIAENTKGQPPGCPLNVHDYAVKTRIPRRSDAV
ncbi:hypothetical protein J2TS6_17100 [Paenibacillus albilobatus]|uniref:Uncharacterized protein n=1 Tax=Paenibacillus albilobatus TaxID=2716884 RepID=A0A919XF56_9BACL|nr:hypothetical protein J2TS6_17100 [Paenibacillus albilobatus]